MTFFTENFKHMTEEFTFINSLKECVFVNLALKIQCHISAILHTGRLDWIGITNPDTLPVLIFLLYNYLSN